MPIYKMDGKKDGKQKYRVRINYVDNTGKSRQIDRVAYGKEEAKDLERQLTLNLREETAPKMTLQQLYEEYIEVKRHEVRESTIRQTIGCLHKYVLSYFAETRIDRLNASMLQKWKLEIENIKLPDTGEPLALRTKQMAYGKFLAMINYAVKMEYIERNPLALVGNFKDVYFEKDEKIHYYTSAEFEKFITCVYEYARKAEAETQSLVGWDMYVFFNIAYFTGMRKGEIYALKWSDISNGLIRVRRSVSQCMAGGPFEMPTKNKSSSRDLQMPLPLVDVLKAHHDRYSHMLRFSDDWRICGGWQVLGDHYIQRYNKRFAEAAGLPVLRVHDFRHSHASLLANEGINIQEIARRLGHSKVETTWSVYSHLYPQEEERAVRILNKIRVKNV